MVDDYFTRFNRLRHNTGLGPASLEEVEDRKGGGISAEAILLERSIHPGALLVVMDECGESLSSRQIADQLAKWRDDGSREVVFCIGGPDGIAESLKVAADFTLSFGRMVWPHKLARVMLAEQLYRAASILSGGPYHRD